MSSAFKTNRCRNELLARCKALIEKLERSEDFMIKGACHKYIAETSSAKLQEGVSYSQPAESASGSTESTSGSDSGGANSVDNWMENVDIEDLYITTHAQLIQEWFYFLDNLFSKSLLHLTQNNNIEYYPSVSVSIKNLDFSGLVSLRQSMVDEASEDFSFQKYPSKITMLRKMLDIGIDDSLKKRMRKHVEVRNLFQHNFGKVSQKSLEAIGDSKMEILEDTTTTKEYCLNEKIKLTGSEIKNVNITIQGISKNFEVEL